MKPGARPLNESHKKKFNEKISRLLASLVSKRGNFLKPNLSDWTFYFQLKASMLQAKSSGSFEGKEFYREFCTGFAIAESGLRTFQPLFFTHHRHW